MYRFGKAIGFQLPLLRRGTQIFTVSVLCKFRVSSRMILE